MQCISGFALDKSQNDRYNVQYMFNAKGELLHESHEKTPQTDCVLPGTSDLGPYVSAGRYHQQSDCSKQHFGC